MASSAILERAATEGWTDEEVVKRVIDGETALYEIIMRRYNQRLYRVAVAILHNESEAEDVMQDAYVRAYQHLGQFAGRAKFSTWLTRIAVHEALSRAHRGARFEELADEGDVSEESMSVARSITTDPERQASTSETRSLLEAAIAKLPASYRAVLVMRDVEELSTAEAAESLGISEENVKVRLHRARGMLRETLYQSVGATSTHAFQFHAVRCDRVVANVFKRIG